MKPGSTAGDSVNSWEQVIRAREEEARIAFLAADIQALEELWSDDFAVNSPLQQVVPKPRVLELLTAGRIRHSAYEVEIEHMSRHGNVVVVMGRDSVMGPPAGVLYSRRFTNVWQLQGGAWRSIARHAHVVSQSPAASAPEQEHQRLVDPQAP